MDYLSITLFLLGVIFLFLGWRWQSLPNEEDMMALKGLAYLKTEILQVQDQVHILENKIQTAQQIELMESARKEVERKEVERKEAEREEVEREEVEREEKSKLYSLKTKEQRERISEVEPKPNIPPKYQEVLDLSARGHSIPQIAQQLLLSQDAVMMVLQTYAIGATR